MFILTKGKPKTTNLIKDRENKIKSGINRVSTGIKADGTHKLRTIELKPYGKRTNIWRINQQQNSKHPAAFPESLIKDHIISWSNEGDLIYDPFMGSGTVAKVSILNNRLFIGSEISLEYCNIANNRINIKTK
jgi:site-specific DNA-methyltransferase (adenine-specific)